MTDPSSPQGTAIAGQPVDFPSAKVFEFLFSQPFHNQSDFVPDQQRVPIVDDERPVFVDEATDRVLTRGQLRDDALSFAAGLQSVPSLDNSQTRSLPATATCDSPHVAPIVLIQLPNCLPFATTALGTMAAGLTATLVSPALTSKEIAWVLQSSKPRLVITATACLPAMRDALRAQDDRGHFDNVPVYTVNVAGDGYPSSLVATSHRNGDADGGSDWKQLLDASTAAVRQPPDFDAKNRAAVILWSSGTSGRSKGVMLSHHALNFSVASLWHDADFYRGQHQRWLGFVPFFHVFGMLNLFLLTIPVGATVYIMPAFSPDAMLAAIPKRQITYLHMAPPVAVLLAKSPAVERYAKRGGPQGRNSFSSVVGGVTGGAPLGHEIVAHVYSRLGFRVRLGYGLTEACSVTLQPGLDGEEMEVQRGSTGQPHWGVELMVVREESRDPAVVGEKGEVLIRSPGLMMGYLPFGGLEKGMKADMAPTVESLIQDGWFKTGDIGSIGADGHLYLSDRIKEIIKVRAFQVAPAELEAVLCGSDEVADAGVVPVRDEAQATEWPRAFVVARRPPKSDAELNELAHRLRELVEKQTARYKWLKGGIVFVDSIPKSPSGKILRRVMKEGKVKGREVIVYDMTTRKAKL